MDKEMEERLKRMMLYSMKDVDWDFSQLSDREKKIIGSPEKLKQMEEWAISPTV